MKKEKAESNQNGNLRRHAEERLKASQSGPVGSKTADGVDAMALVHELQVHQIELEMQNEELKRAKLEMEDALTKYSDLYDFAPIGLFAIDQQGIIQEVNKAGAALLGIERRNLMNRHFQLCVAPKDRSRFDDFCKSAFETSFKKTCEMNLLKEGKPTVYARIESTAAEDSSPNGRQCRIAVIDITERKNAEEKLAQQSAVLKAVIESSKGPIFSVDRKYRYTSFNSQHAEVMKTLFGADIEIGHSILDYHTNIDNRISAQMNIDRTLCGESLTLEACAGDKALSRRYFEISHNPVRDSHGEITGVAVFARDLTEHKRTEKALMESEEKYRVLFNSAADAVVILDLEGHFQEVNDEAVKRLGYSRDDS
jgi:PAS domain S-box-containing protein